MLKAYMYFRDMLKISLFFIIFLCAGCTQKSATDSILESVEQQIVALEQSLPAECKTESINTQISAIKATNESVAQSCRADVAKVETQRDKWMMAFFAIAFVLGWIFIKKVGKHV